MDDCSGALKRDDAREAKEKVNECRSNAVSCSIEALSKEKNSLLSPAIDELSTYALHHSCEVAQLLDSTIVKEYNLLQ